MLINCSVLGIGNSVVNHLQRGHTSVFRMLEGCVCVCVCVCVCDGEHLGVAEESHFGYACAYMSFNFFSHVCVMCVHVCMYTGTCEESFSKFTGHQCMASGVFLDH